MAFYKRLCLYFLFFSVSLSSSALTFSDAVSRYANAFSALEGSNEGIYSFPSFLIPSGAKTESLGGALTAMQEGIESLDSNPAITSVLDRVYLQAYHNMWIADSNMETLAGTGKIGKLGLGAMLRCFYVPFTQYGGMGEQMMSNYYTETCALLNTSYNFFSGYRFKGLSLGANLKFAWRGVPDYADESGSIVSHSGLSQSAFALAMDVGILLRFNAGKLYVSREPNLAIGISLVNTGFALTGFKESVQIDDPLPTMISAGISYRIIKRLLLSLDFKQPFNLFNIREYQMWQLGFGISVKATDFLEVLSGFQLKGANPRISLGLEFLLQERFAINANYTFDLTSSATTINRFSVSAKILLGQNKREQKQKLVDALYQEGLLHYKNGDFEKAIDTWKQVLKLDKRFDPAKEAIANAERLLSLYNRIQKSQQLD
ncbi:MAG: UPF0164 family protein [Treponema sp.]|nr:UPF0164 family protein [Treponema sp.]